MEAKKGLIMVTLLGQRCCGARSLNEVVYQLILKFGMSNEVRTSGSPGDFQ